MTDQLSVLEICAGAGGQALGLEEAGFKHELAVEIDRDACATLRLNRPGWCVLNEDIRNVSVRGFGGVDLIAGGVPCPPFSVAGRQLGSVDDRDLFPEALRIVDHARPRAVLLENVRGLSTKKFASYRRDIIQELHRLGYQVFWELINASDFGVPQLRPRFILVALRDKEAGRFHWPEPFSSVRVVGQAVGDLMAADGWSGAPEWVRRANAVAPTIVGGSRKHGGADLGPTRAKLAWATLGVDGAGIADAPPDVTFPIGGSPRLTLRMVARIQGFPDAWHFAGRKTSTYRQVGNAFPPPFAHAIGGAIRQALDGSQHTTGRATQADLFGRRLYDPVAS